MKEQRLRYPKRRRWWKKRTGGLAGEMLYCVAWILITHMFDSLLCSKIIQAFDRFTISWHCLNVLFKHTVSSTAGKKVVVYDFYTNFPCLATIYSVSFFRTQFRVPFLSYTKCLSGWPSEPAWKLWTDNTRMHFSVGPALFVSKFYF